MQDTIRQKVLPGNDTLIQVRDTVKEVQKSDAGILLSTVRKTEVTQIFTTYTTTLCTKGVIANVTFYDTTNFIRTLNPAMAGNFPEAYIEKRNEFISEKKEIYSKTLKSGTELPPGEFNADWIVPVALFSLFLFALVRNFPGSFFRNMIRFVMMRGINENSSRDTGVIFQWQATLLNLASFISIGLFGYLSLKHNGIVSESWGGFLTWLICFAVLSFSVAVRHLICNITGSISGQQEIFREYLVSVYNFYRIAGIIFLTLDLLILYTVFLPPKYYFLCGIVAAISLYLLRISRLLLIFIIRRVSILYLILYLCALEILPVVIIVKYITGLV